MEVHILLVALSTNQMLSAPMHTTADAWSRHFWKLLGVFQNKANFTTNIKSSQAKTKQSKNNPLRPLPSPLHHPLPQCRLLIQADINWNAKDTDESSWFQSKMACTLDSSSNHCVSKLWKKQAVLYASCVSMLRYYHFHTVYNVYHFQGVYNARLAQESQTIV